MSDATKNAILIFPDGTTFRGVGVGKKGVVKGEICFNTAVTGYQEILSDPSYYGQIITFTFVHIGNVGVNENDIESQIPKASGLIIRENITNPSNYRSKKHFNSWLQENGLTGISGVDTRQITKFVRKNGAKTIAIIFADEISDQLIEETRSQISKSGDLKGVELAGKASLNKNYNWGLEASWNQAENSYHQQKDKKFKVVAIDYGAKLNILRCLTQIGANVEIVGAKTSFEEIIKHKPDGIFLSNGPGDPAETAKFATPIIEKILQANIPLFGICLGHQLLALTIGAKTKKMEQGHRGANHPVLNLKTKKVEITSQNHGFCVDETTLPDTAEVTHISLFDRSNEGIELKNKKAFSVQHHPESSPGPSDSFYLFEQFAKMMEK